MSRNPATLIGFTAVLFWSLLALLTVGANPIPPLQLNAICFGIGAVFGFIWIWRTTGFSVLSGISWKIYAFGTAGLFGYHFLYFSALRLAPPAQAGLIAYLWPLLIILFSGMLPGEKLRFGHIVGGLLGFAGAAVIIVGGDAGFLSDTPLGYSLALLCAFVWAGYSVLSRRLGNIPTGSVAVFCLLTSILSLAAHFALEQTVWPSTTIGWVSLTLLGLGPVGVAFFLWDVGVKQGNIQLLGVASYAAPLFSTFILVAAKVAEPTWMLLLATGLITGGAGLAAFASAK